jgi:uncharacterized protein (DUF111 family)
MTPVTARGGRPGHLVTALAGEAVRTAVTEALFAHTCTLGVRWWRAERRLAARSFTQVLVGPADDRRPVRVKVADGVPGRTVQPEFADVARVAAALSWPQRAVVDAAVRAYWDARRGAVPGEAPPDIDKS